MLPYRLRAPPKAGPWKNMKEEDPLLLGGPMQRAIEHDILEIRDEFLNAEPPVAAGHAKAGATFQQFSSIFGSNKIGLLHSCTIPPRCDQDAYTQLIYASCLSLIKKSMEEMASLRHASFGLFSLYAFFQTCPIPERTQNELQMLPMGLQGENPKKQFRRHFKTRIRIDPYHFSLLQRLRDEALATQADCQVHLLMDCKENMWACQCSAATDVIHILNRLRNSWDYSMYTGPRSVEGLAGHADYPFGCIRPKNEVMQAPVTLLETSVFEEAQECRMNNDWHEIETAVGIYQRSLRSLVVPKASASNQSTRIRTALDPIFASEPWDQFFTRIMKQEAHSEMSHPASPGSLPGEKFEANANEAASDNMLTSDIKAPSIHFRLTLPEGLRTETSAGIRRAVYSLLEYGEFGAKNREEKVPLGATNIPEMYTDDVSSVGQGGVSVRRKGGASQLRNIFSSTHSSESVSIASTSGDSIDTGQGRGTSALRTLLASANSMGRVSKVQSKLGIGKVEQASVTEMCPTLIIQPVSASVAVHDSETGHGRGAVELRALLPIGGASTTAASFNSQETGQGRAALRDLLSSVPSDPLSKTPPNRVPFSISRTATHVPQSQGFLTMTSRESESDEDSNDVSDVSSASSGLDEVSIATSAVGQVALRKLMSSVNGGTENTKRKESGKKRAKGYSPKKRKVKNYAGDRQPQGTKIRQDLVEGSLSGDSDDCELTATSRNFGRAALEHLMAQVSVMENH